MSPSRRSRSTRCAMRTTWWTVITGSPRHAPWAVCTSTPSCTSSCFPGRATRPKPEPWWDLHGPRSGPCGCHLGIGIAAQRAAALRAADRFARPRRNRAGPVPQAAPPDPRAPPLSRPGAARSASRRPTKAGVRRPSYRRGWCPADVLDVMKEAHRSMADDGLSRDPTTKKIALVAHDNIKGDLLEQDLTVRVHKLQSGPLGGDQQVGAGSPRE